MTTKTAPGKRRWTSAKLQGKRVAFTGKLSDPDRDRVAATVRAEGAKVLDDVDETCDYLVVGRTSGAPTAAEKKASRLIQTKNAPIQIISEADFRGLLDPTREEVIAMLTGGEAGGRHFASLAVRVSPWLVGLPDLSGADLGGMQLDCRRVGWLDLQPVKLDGADLCGARLANVGLPVMQSVRLDRAVLVDCTLRELTGCILKGADLTASSHLNAERLRSCDFTRGKLAGVTLAGSDAADSIFREADLSRANLDGAQLQRTDFTGANLSGAEMLACDLTDARLTGADMQKADMTAAKLVNADLSGADLRGAVLTDADLTGARIEGTRFEGAITFGARLDGVAVDRASGLERAQSAAVGAAGPNVRELEKVAKQAKEFHTDIVLDLDDGRVQLSVMQCGPHVYSHHTVERGDSTRGRQGAGGTLGAAMSYLANRWGGGRPRLDSVAAKIVKGPINFREARQLATLAWCEVLGIDTPSPEKLDEKVQSQKAGQQALREQLLADLRSGPKGVKKWNVLTLQERQRAGMFRRVDLSGVNLAGVDFDALDFAGANFEGAILTRAKLGQYANFSQANFKNANLDRSDGGGGKFSRAVFDGASLKKARLRACPLAKASFKNADLEGADLTYCDLRGTDLSSANLQDVKWQLTRFYEDTQLPAGFQPPDGMKWVGKGVDPRTRPPAIVQRAAPLDFDTFMAELEQHADAAKLDKALAMLKADRFRLFAQVEPDSLVGVVKSQTDASLVYSCRLGADGNFACCTQNLNICGGLRGSLCKHLLVLIVGLTKAGELDPTTVDQWVQASRFQKPLLDKDAMSATFLRYKGAEAGEVDWRPTETIPEDYYAM